MQMAMKNAFSLSFVALVACGSTASDPRFAEDKELVPALEELYGPDATHDLDQVGVVAGLAGRDVGHRIQSPPGQAHRQVDRVVEALARRAGDGDLCPLR